VVAVESYATFEEAVEKANSTRFGLQAAIFTARHDRALAAHRRLAAGAVIVNDAPFYRAVQMPYGGVRDSGHGREGVRYAMEEMTEVRTLILPVPEAFHPTG
jgi:acyl-CoA reductase-like NAD-dependent aldehyde dehydrogenase